MIKLPFFAVYIINQVKLRRLIKGYSARKLSEDIGLESQLVSKYENETNKNLYSPQILIKIARILGCSVRDFYPSDEVLMQNDGEHVNKIIISLSNLEDVKKIIAGLVDDGYFSKSRTFEKITKYLHIDGKPESAVVKQGLDWAIVNGLLTMNDSSFIVIG
ncbi:helix-turn-helix domain-containing protein [Sphingobacterium anhuiense]|uniref:helix-turn-helix domain-containing protein n=1 Tax=Sphingobacterium anhuiense TaxID=493780 RepID=UPI003C2C101B